MNALSSLVVRFRVAIVVMATLIVGGAAAVGVPVLHQLGGGNPDFVTPGSPSQDAVAVLEDTTGTVPDGGLIALVDTGEPVGSRATQEVIADVVERLGEEDAIATVIPPAIEAAAPGAPSAPSAPSTPSQGGPGQVSEDGDSAYVLALWDADATDGEMQETIDRLDDELAELDGVSLGGSEVVGNQVVSTVLRDLTRAELAAFPVLILLSLLIFRGLVAGMLPLLLGGVNILFALAGVRLVHEQFEMSIFALNLVTALGLGLAIDYGLLIVSRYRAELAAGLEPEAAVRETMTTAGRTVLLSAVTVAAAMACLFVFEQRFLYSMAVGGILVAVSGALAALIVLPALLAVLGRRIDALAPRRWRQQLEGGESDARWLRIARSVAARPVIFALAGTTALVLLAAPLANIAFTAVSAKDVPGDQSAHQVDQRLTDDFASNPRENVVVVLHGAADAPEVQDVADEIAGLDGADVVSPPVPLDADTTMLTVDPLGAGMAPESLDLVQDVRALSTPDLRVQVAGESANFADLRDSVVANLPLAAGLVIIGTLLVLLLLTRSVLLPLMSVVMNLLTLGATFGILVLTFQDGLLGGLLGFTAQGALDLTMPVLLFALVFGLSTDYGVFLLDRMREAREGGASDRDSVVLGMARTGRIVTAAALLFCVALGALVTSDIVFIKMLGLGTALGVLLDATIVRMMLVPSLMTLFGRASWWGPWSRTAKGRSRLT
ncbi:MMPL family transporter [Antribacter gilvus]|uniref:MMPL family transporter n=1 Tax=Antribacter gilvus TaxID=2304675 RepID=UPI000F78C2D7|nr:MMPL family transporter [Antribacter gilvus]